jgi:hypothetical protein
MTKQKPKGNQMDSEYYAILEQRRVDMAYEYLAKALDLIANAGVELTKVDIIRPDNDFLSAISDRLGAIWTEIKEHYREDAENELAKMKVHSLSEIIGSLQPQGLLVTDC